MKKKWMVLLSGLFLSAVLLVFLLLFFKPWLTKEQRILNQIMGAYSEGEYIGAFDTSAYRVPSPTRTIDNTPVYWIYPDSFGMGGPNKDTSNYSFREIENAKYTLKEIDKEMLNNGINDQGLSLRRSLIPNAAALDDYKDKYAIFINDAEGSYTEEVLFYLDGNLYTSRFVYKLERVENAEHPLTMPKGKFSNDSVMKKLEGKTFSSQYFLVFDPVTYQTTISFDKRLTESDTVKKSKQFTIFGVDRFFFRIDNRYFRESKFTEYSIYNHPQYEMIEIDEAFYNNGVFSQGFALHKMIDSVEELNQYQEKIAIIIHPKKSDNNYVSESYTYFYLDGALYYSPNEFSFVFSLLPMEPMKGKGFTR